MPAETKRAATGVYMLFLGEQVSETDLLATMHRYQQSAADEQVGSYSVVIDPIKLKNPLKMARLVAKHTDAHTMRYVVVESGRQGSVLVERLAQKLPDVTIEVMPTQTSALNRAKDLQGVADEDSAACDYL